MTKRPDESETIAAGGLTDSVPRRMFVRWTGLVGVAAVAPVVSNRGAPWEGETAPADFPRNELSLVNGVVGASHGNLERVRDLVLEQPALAKASWDWGFGDWETALGAASHTGRREIAEFLIGHGARPTIFSAAMMGEVDVVRAFLDSSPDLHQLDGPHGLPLIQHARAGGDDAESVVDYLLDRFGDLDESMGFAGDEIVLARYGGRYRFDTTPVVTLTVGVRNELLMYGAGETPSSRVREAGPDAFSPTGAPAVVLRFNVVDGQAQALTIEDGGVSMTGRRVRG